MDSLWVTIAVLERSTLFYGVAFIALPYLYSGSMLINPLSLFINVISFKSSFSGRSRNRNAVAEKQIFKNLFFLLKSWMPCYCTDHLPSRQYLAYPTKCNEWNLSLVTASPLPLVPHVHQWLPCMLQIPLQPMNRSVIAPSLPWQCQGSTL